MCSILCVVFSIAYYTFGYGWMNSWLWAITNCTSCSYHIFTDRKFWYNYGTFYNQFLFISFFELDFIQLHWVHFYTLHFSHSSPFTQLLSTPMILHYSLFETRSLKNVLCKRMLWWYKIVLMRFKLIRYISYLSQSRMFNHSVSCITYAILLHVLILHNFNDGIFQR